MGYGGYAGGGRGGQLEEIEVGWGIRGIGIWVKDGVILLHWWICLGPLVFFFH